MKLKRSIEYLLLTCCLIINSLIPVGITYADGNVIEKIITMDDRLIPKLWLAKPYVRISDITPPKIDVSSLIVEPKEARPGEQVKISVKVTDDLSGVATIQVWYQMPDSNSKKLIIMYPIGNDMYEGILEINEYTPSGLWEIDCIDMYDNQNNSIFIYNDNINSYGEYREDLSAGNFNVTGTNADITPPKIDVSSLIVEPKEARPGEQVKISVKVTDDLSGVATIQVWYQMPDSNSKKLIIMYPIGNDMYEGILEINEYTPSGLWEIDCIDMYDNQNNSIFIYNDNINSYGEYQEDLSAGNFVVLADDSLIAPLEDVTVITQNETWTNKTINGDLYIGPNAVLTVNGNVKVDGNVYVLGGLKSYGGLTINGTLYGKNMSFGSSLMLHNGTVIISGTNSIYSMNMSNYPVTDLPIRIDNLPLVSNNGKVTIQGATVNVAQMYIEGEEVKLDNKGRFDLIDFYVGNKNDIIIEFKTVFGNIITKRFEISQENIIKEDINHDGIVNKQDLELLSNYYNVTRSDYNWNEELDMNDDGIIDLYDVVFISKKIEDEENVDIVVTHFEVDKIGGSIRYKFPNNNATFSQVEVLVNDENVTANLIGAGGGGPEGGNMFWTFTDELVQGENKIEVRITYTIDEKSSMISKVTSILK